MSRELTREEKATIRKLVTKWCANYDKEYGCLLGLGFPRKQCLRGKRRNSEMSELSPTAEVRDMELVTTSECYMLGKCARPRKPGFAPSAAGSFSRIGAHATAPRPVPKPRG